MNDQETNQIPQYGNGPLTLSGPSNAQRVTAGSSAVWKLILKPRQANKMKVRIVLTITYGTEDEPEWDIVLSQSSGKLWESAKLTVPDVEFSMEGMGGKEITLSAESPRGARLDDSVHIKMQVIAEGQECGNMEFFANTMQSILILKTSIGHERAVVDGVAGKAKIGNDKGIFALLAPGKLDGYVFMEAMNTDLVRETCRGVRKAKGLVDGETNLTEIEHFLTPKPLVSGISEGDVVELVAGPFKGEKARVQKIDESKEEITVELFEATVPIPVTVRGDSVRVLEKER
ncbi:MAG TPA: transcription elongation factor Spt5 [Methanomassiliicoccales archaeon]|nr:transcription elongation factor Spt5 [Methanomassiliicoccales archaeon]HNX47367.1 transcription elongation factor Spt5 [Methanomassiliicoccales archaeon]HPR98029.1 transcription elongation factor Spt5 [Methanomassiliicoccales archaeon]HSA35010.1 transcription elongation factor Spt5 [Methanomassiliicoccales archaeon]